MKTKNIILIVCQLLAILCAASGAIDTAVTGYVSPNDYINICSIVMLQAAIILVGECGE